MKIAKFLVYFSITLTALLCPAKFIPATTHKLRVIYYPFPPDIFEAPKGIQGAAHDVWERAAKRAHLSLEWVGPIPYLRALNMLEEGRVDAIFRLAKTPEREEKFIFSDNPPLWGKTGIIVRASEPLDKITNEKQIIGKKIGLLRGGTPPPFLAKISDQIAWESVTHNSHEINMEKLKNSHIWGVYFIFSSTARFYMAQHHESLKFKILPFPGSEKPNLMYAAFSKKADPELVRRMKEAFNEEIPKYDYEKLSEKYIEMAEKGLFNPPQH